MAVMAVINREACFYKNALGVESGPPVFEGIGWATMSLDEIGCRAWFRVLYVDRGFPGRLYVVESRNRRWPLWRVILRGWLFLRWLERNTRRTAAVWGLLETEIGARPSWRDLRPLLAVKRWLI